VLVVAVDREQGAVVAPLPDDVGPIADLDLQVAVGQPALELADPALSGGELGDPVEYLLK